MSTWLLPETVTMAADGRQPPGMWFTKLTCWRQTSIYQQHVYTAMYILTGGGKVLSTSCTEMLPTTINLFLMSVQVTFYLHMCLFPSLRLRLNNKHEHVSICISFLYTTNVSSLSILLCFQKQFLLYNINRQKRSMQTQFCFQLDSHSLRLLARVILD